MAIKNGAKVEDFRVDFIYLILFQGSILLHFIDKIKFLLIISRLNRRKLRHFNVPIEILRVETKDLKEKKVTRDQVLNYILFSRRMVFSAEKHTGKPKVKRRRPHHLFLYDQRHTSSLLLFLSI